ncbi:MAG TPA: hypothetical protein VF115_02285, partial [Acidimicrobiia bacterium]
DSKSDRRAISKGGVSVRVGDDDGIWCQRHTVCNPRVWLRVEIDVPVPHGGPPQGITEVEPAFATVFDAGGKNHRPDLGRPARRLGELEEQDLGTLLDLGQLTGSRTSTCLLLT